MPTLKQLKYLAAIAETRHFRRAAEINHVSQPTLSGQLRTLEERLGVQLVERSRSHVVLTPVGREIAARARKVLHEVEEIVALARLGHSPLGGTLRLGVLPTVGPYLLPLILPALHRAYPALKLYVREGVPQVLLTGLAEGGFDLLLFPLPVREADFQVEALFREALWVALPAEHPLASQTHVEPTDLKGETILALEQGHRLHEQVRQVSEQYGAHLSLDYEGTSLDALRQMVGMGMGVAFLPALYVRSEVPKDADVVARPMRRTPPTRTIGLVWRRSAAREADYRNLAAIARQILATDVPEVSVSR